MRQAPCGILLQYPCSHLTASSAARTLCMDSTFSVTGGASIGWWWHVTTPFARLSADRDVLRLHCSIYGRDYVFDRSNIKRLSRRSDIWFSTGLRIEHTVPLYPKF